MAARSLSIMQTVDRLAEGGRFLAGQKVFGGLPRWPRCTTGCLDSMISSRTRSPNGRLIRANRGSPFDNYSARPTGLKAHQVFNAHRFGTETPWQFDCPALLNRVRLSSMAQAIFRFSPNYCAGNWEVVAQSHTLSDMYPTGLDWVVLTTKKTPEAISYWRQDLN